MKIILLFTVFFTTLCSCYGQSNDLKNFTLRLENFDSTISEREIIDHSKSIESLTDSEKARFYNALGNFYAIIKREYSKSSINFYQTLEFKNILPYQKANALNGLGYIYSGFYRHDLALKNYKKSLDIMEKEVKDSIDGITTLYNNIGQVFSKENQKDSALFYLRKGKEIAETSGKPSDAIYFNLGHQHPDLDSSYIYTKKAYDLAVGDNNQQMITFCLLNLGTIEIGRNRFHRADSLLSASHDLANSIGLDAYLPEVWEQQGISKIKRGQFKEGINKINKGLPYFESTNNYIQLSSSYLYLEKAYIGLKDFENAYYAKGKKLATDSTQKANERLKKAEGSIIYTTRNELQLLKEQTLRNQKHQYIKIVIGVLLTLICTALFFTRRRKQQNKKYKEVKKKVNELVHETEFNNQKLLFKSLMISEKQEFLGVVLGELKDLLNSPGSSNTQKEKIRGLYQKIQQGIKDKQFNEFEYYFDKVHPEFYRSLKNLGFELSKNEIRLSAFIKLNFTTKEISDITKQSSNSLNVSKSRLKTKLNLGKDESLYDFLQSI